MQIAPEIQDVAQNYLDGDDPEPGSAGRQRAARAVRDAARPRRRQCDAQPDQLDTNLDWSTFQFGMIQFGEHTIVVPDPAGRLHCETDTTVSYDAYPVHVTADFNPGTGALTRELQSVDPQTGHLPHDLLSGFLPPNDGLNRGAGFVSYSIRPKPVLPDGTEICNRATIVFDFNDPIVTNEVVYSIDAAPPSSAVAALPATMSTDTFLVTWSGSDPGAGIASYAVYVSDNGGPFQV